jgi:hypothetical protein
MAHDTARTVAQSVREPGVQDIALPTPRKPVLEPAGLDIARPAAPAAEPAVHDISRPAAPPVHESRAGWVLSTVAVAAAAWTVGWVSGVSWAWRAMTPRHLRRSHRLRGGGLPGPGSFSRM